MKTFFNSIVKNGKAILTFIAGAILGGIVQDILVRLVEFDWEITDLNFVMKTLFTYFLATIIGISLGVLSYRYWDNPVEKISIWWRKKRKNQIKVGILYGIPWKDGKDNDTYHSWTDIKPETWKERFEDNQDVSLRVDYVDFFEELDLYDIVLNPYGGVYKDKDLDKRPVLQKVLNYVKNGGIFINSNDTPFYYTYREELKSRTESKVYGFLLPEFNGTPAQITPLLKELNIYCTQHIQRQHIDEFFTDEFKDLEKEEKPNIKLLSRFSKNTIQGFNGFRSVLKTDEEGYSPLFFYNYGNGSFLFNYVPTFLDKESVNIDYSARLQNLIVEVSLRETHKY